MSNQVIQPSSIDPSLFDFASMSLGVVSSLGQMSAQAAPLIAKTLPQLAEAALSEQLLFRRLGMASMALSAGSSAYKLFISDEPLTHDQSVQEAFNLCAGAVGLGGMLLSSTPAGKMLMVASAGFELINAIQQIKGISDHGLDFNNGFWLAQTATQLGLALCLRMTPASKLPRMSTDPRMTAYDDLSYQYTGTSTEHIRTFIPCPIKPETMDPGFHTINDQLIVSGDHGQIRQIGEYTDRGLELFGVVVVRNHKRTGLPNMDIEASQGDTIKVQVGNTRMETNKLTIDTPHPSDCLNEDTQYRWNKIWHNTSGKPIAVTVAQTKIAANACNKFTIEPNGSCTLEGIGGLVLTHDNGHTSNFPIAHKVIIHPDGTANIQNYDKEIFWNNDTLTVDPKTHPLNPLILDMKWKQIVFDPAGIMIFGRALKGDSQPSQNIRVQIGSQTHDLPFEALNIAADGRMSVRLDTLRNFTLAQDPLQLQKIRIDRIFGTYNPATKTLTPEWVVSKPTPDILREAGHDFLGSDEMVNTTRLYRVLDGHLIYDSQRIDIVQTPTSG